MSAAPNPALRKALLLGLARAPLAPDAVQSNDALDDGGEPIGTLLQRQPQEQMLWHAIAADDLLQRAGYVPPSLAAGEAAAPDQGTCPSAAEQVLTLLLRGLHPELLDTWLQQARACQFSLPHVHIPALLDAGLQKTALRQVLVPLLDKRGHWLIAQHAEWAKCYGTAGDDTQAQWTLGNLAERVQALRTMRESDPAAALAALQADWASEPAENRAALLPCLAVKLSLQDECFLELALDDKRKEVRSAAQQLLANLPGSQLVQRCIARLAPLVVCTKEGSGAPQLAVALPQACDKSMLRDGIGLQTRHGLGEKASWLFDLMQCVPPAHWSDSWDLPPHQVIALMAQQEFKQALLSGLTQAALQALRQAPNQAAIDWYAALLQSIVSGTTGIPAPPNLMQVFGLLPAQVQHDIVQGWLADAHGTWTAQNPIIDWCREAAERAGAPWPATLSRKVLARAQAGLVAAPEHHWRLQAALNSLARVLDSTDLAYSETGWPDAEWIHWPHWRIPIDNLLETLRFRNTLQRSFLETTA